MGSKGLGKLPGAKLLGLDGDGGAGAAQAAAMSQQREARSQYGEQAGMIRGASTASLAQMDQALQMQERNLARQEQLIAQIDPTIMEASQQALRLLKGESSSTLAPLERQRDMQRQKLMNSLREQLGPGAETSTAGIQALTRFDAETGTLMSGAQQQSLGNLGNIFGQFSAAKPNMTGEIGGLAALAGQRANIGYGGAAALGQAGQGMLQTAGAQYTGAVIKGQQQSALQNQIVGGAVQAGTMAMMSDRRAKKNIFRVKTSIFRDVPTYMFEYIDPKHGNGVYIGTMAQDLLAIDPNHPAVEKTSEGYKVKYDLLERTA
jgi:hypothetical protein